MTHSDELSDEQHDESEHRHGHKDKALHSPALRTTVTPLEMLTVFIAGGSIWDWKIRLAAIPDPNNPVPAQIRTTAL